MSIERIPVAVTKNQPVTRPGHARHSRGSIVLGGLLAGSLFLAGCGKESVSGEGSATAAPATTTTEPATTTTETTTTTTTTTTPEQPSTATEIITKSTLCAMDVAAVLPNATCTDITSEDDKHFSTVLEAVRYQSDVGTVDVKVIEDHGEFQTPAKYNGTNVQFEERKAYGLAEFNTLCSPDACYALDASPEESEGMGPIVYEVASGDMHLNLALLGRVATGSAN